VGTVSVKIDPKWFTVIGLVSDLIGAGLLCYGLIISKKQAIELGVSRICGDHDDENLMLPQVADRLKQSRNAIIGIFFLGIGFLLQIYGSWPR